MGSQYRDDAHSLAGPVTASAVDDSNNVVYAAFESGDVVCHSLIGGKVLFRFSCSKHPVLSLDIATDGKSGILCGPGKTLFWFDVDTKAVRTAVMSVTTIVFP